MTGRCGLTSVIASAKFVILRASSLRARRISTHTLRMEHPLRFFAHPSVWAQNDTPLVNAGPNYEGSSEISSSLRYNFAMPTPNQSEASSQATTVFTAADVLAILRQRGWLTVESSPEIDAWCGHAAAILGGHAADRAALADLLSLVFHYDAKEILSRVDSHVVLSRYAAREVLRQLALLLLGGAPLTSEKFKEVVTALRGSMDLRGRELFHPIRLVLAGRAGEGELDRVILLLDEAAVLPFAAPVKSTRVRVLEFCAALN